MKLICACDTSGLDVSAYAVVTLDPEAIRAWLAMRPVVEAARKALSQPLYRLEVWGGDLDWYWDGLPEDLSAKGEGTVDRGLSDHDWVVMPRRWPGGIEPAADADLDCTSAMEDGIYFTASVSTYGGDVTIETKRLSWAELEQVLAGENPWAPAVAA